MTQAQLAEAAGLHEQFVSQLERQERSATIETLDALAEALGVTPWELLRPDDAPIAEERPAQTQAEQLLASWPERQRSHLVKLLIELRLLALSATPRGGRKKATGRRRTNRR